MAKEKNVGKSKKEEVVLTEWQKRNIEFLKKKEAEQLEKEKLQEKIRLEHQNLLKVKSNQEKDDKSDEADVKVKNKAKQKNSLKPKKVKKKSSISRKSKWKATPFLILSFFVLVFNLFLVTPYSKQKVLSVTGVNHTDENSVITAASISDTDYFFSLILNKETYENNVVANNDWVKSAKLVYSFPNSFTFDVEEYQVVGYAKVDAGYQPILENGKHMGAVGESELPDSYLTINMTSEEDIQTLVKVLNKLDASLVSLIKTVNSVPSNTTSDLLLIEMTDGNSVRVPLSEIVEKLPYYSKIKDNLTEASIVDMEVGIYTTTASIESSEPSDTQDTSESSEDVATDADTETATESTEEVQSDISETENQIETEESSEGDATETIVDDGSVDSP